MLYCMHESQRFSRVLLQAAVSQSLCQLLSGWLQAFFDIINAVPYGEELAAAFAALPNMPDPLSHGTANFSGGTFNTGPSKNGSAQFVTFALRVFNYAPCFFQVRAFPPAVKLAKPVACPLTRQAEQALYAMMRCLGSPTQAAPSRLCSSRPQGSENAVNIAPGAVQVVPRLFHSMSNGVAVEPRAIEVLPRLILIKPVGTNVTPVGISVTPRLISIAPKVAVAPHRSLG